MAGATTFVKLLPTKLNDHGAAASFQRHTTIALRFASRKSSPAQQLLPHFFTSSFLRTQQWFFLLCVSGYFTPPPNNKRRRDETGKLVGMFAPRSIAIRGTKEFFETISDESSLSSFARGGKVERRKTQPFSSPPPFFSYFSVKGRPSPRRFPTRDEDLLKQYLILLKSDEAMR